MRSKSVRAWAEDWRGRFVDTLPTILFFIALFWIVHLAFGSNYLLAVSPYTSLFQARLRKYNPPGQYARFVLVSALALVAARVAVVGVVPCIAVNLLMPFLLVFMRSSQLNPRRYFPYTMLFCFLELRPETLVDTFATQALVLATCCVTLIVTLAVAGRLQHHAQRARARLHELVGRLADDLSQASKGGIGPNLSSELLQLRRDFARMAYTAREDSSAPVRVQNLLDMFATLAQRTAYLAGNFDWDASHQEEHVRALSELGRLTHDLNAALEGDVSARCHRLIPRAQELLDGTSIAEDRFRIFYQSYLNLVLLILRTAPDPHQHPWRLSASDLARVTSFRKRLSLESFEMRFSIRCGAVLAVSCASNLLFPVDHLYWFALHAFLLLQPFPHESLHRMRTRMVGTVIGCLFVHGLALLNLGWVEVTILGMFLVGPMYATKPGSVPSAFFATAYAVSMASVSIDDRYATTMRIASLLLAIATVAIVNRLVCPTSERRLFVANFHQMIGMVGRYWHLIRLTLTHRVDTVVSSETLLHFQMLHTQATEFVESLDEAGEKDREIAELARYRDAADRALFCLWEIMCELEQLELLVRLHEVGDDERPLFERIIDLTEANCDPRRFGTGVDAAEEMLFELEEPDLRYVLEQYVDRAGELRLAIDDARGALVQRPTYVEEIRP